MANVRLKDSAYAAKITSFTFPAPACASATLQQELLRYRNCHHRPLVIKTLPYGPVQIRMRGTDTFIVNHQPVVFNRYTINGLVWGNEFLWSDGHGDIISLITNDQTGHKFEFKDNRPTGKSADTVSYDTQQENLRNGKDEELSSHYNNMVSSVFDYAMTADSQQKNTTKGTLVMLRTAYLTAQSMFLTKQENWNIPFRQ